MKNLRFPNERTKCGRPCAGCGKPAKPWDRLCESCSDKVDLTVLSFDVAPVQGELFVKSTHNPPK